MLGLPFCHTMLVAGIYQHANRSQKCFQCKTQQHLHGDPCGLFKLLFVYKWFVILLTITFGAQFDTLGCWINHKPYLKSARARAIVLFFVCTHCLTLWSSGCWIGVTDAITKQPVTAQGPLGTQTVRKIRPSGSIHHCFSITSQRRHIRENGAE